MRVRIRITAHTRVQASYTEFTIQPIPFPPTHPLKGRAGMYVKYFLPPNGAGTIFLRGDDLLQPAVPTGGSKTAFSITGVTGSLNKNHRKNNHIFVPIAESVRAYLLVATTLESSGTLEY